MAVRTWKRRLGWMAVAAGVVAALAGLLMLYLRSWTPSRTDYPMQGVDISAAQGAVHWPTLAAKGTDFAYVRATSGDAVRDPRFPDHWRDAEQAGIGRGAVHAFDLCRLARDQGTNFIATVPREETALPPVIDLALTGSCAARPGREVVLSELAILIEMIEAHAGKRAILHLARDFEARYGIAGAIDRTLWLDRAFLPPDYGGRPWVMWQATTMRRIEGVEGPVHWNVIRQ